MWPLRVATQRREATSHTLALSDEPVMSAAPSRAKATEYRDTANVWQRRVAARCVATESGGALAGGDGPELDGPVEQARGEGGAVGAQGE